MHVADFQFELPDELIAQEAAPRGTSRLLLLDRTTGAVHHARIADLPSILHPGDLLVVNNTRVFAARLLGHRVPSGGAVECLLLEPPEADPGSRIPHPGTRVAQALMHPGQKLKVGALVRFEGPAGVLMAEVLDRHFYGRRTIRLWAESALPRRSGEAAKAGPDVDALIDALGHIPLPPYIRRADTPADRDRYQTVFARVRGSVAAPTAGLHFDDALLARLAERGIERAEITLHVGYGTFKPVRAERVEEHVVDPEHYEISESAAAAITRARAARRRVIAVGTTTTRALEDAAMRGNGRVIAGTGTASLFIYPGHEFRVIDGLLTNFHLPASSLLMLVAAFAGRERALAAYRDAVEQRYRFYSYGDAMLIV
jgi:S-adenosylmethionine:tRNA ribosyltransferase-isomerase